MELLEARIKKRITQWDIAIATGICQAKVSLIERGYVIPSEKERSLIIGVLGCCQDEIEWLDKRKDRGAFGNSEYLN